MEKKAVDTSIISDGCMDRRRLIINDFLDFLKVECRKYANLLTLVTAHPPFPPIMCSLKMCVSALAVERIREKK